MKTTSFHKLIIIATLLCILASCQVLDSIELSGTNPDKHLSPRPIAVSNTLATILQYIDYPNAPSDWSHRFSPDGEWYVKNSVLENHAIGFDGFSIRDPQTGFKTNRDFDLTLGKYQALSNWATDSSAFTVVAVDEPRPKCPFTQVIIYTRGDDQQFSPGIFEPDTDGTCVQPSWAPDNTKVAVTVMTDPGTIYLIDKQGNLERQLDLRWEDTFPKNISPALWVDDMLIFSVDYPYDDNGHSLNELRIIDLTTSEQEILFSGYDTYFAVVGVEQDGKRILIREVNENSKNEFFSLHVYDLVTQKIDETLQIQGRLLRSVQLLSPYIAFQIEAEYLSDEYHLWVFDWKTLQVMDYGVIMGLVTWFPQEEGFLIVQSHDENNYYFEIVQP